MNMIGYLIGCIVTNIVLHHTMGRSIEQSFQVFLLTLVLLLAVRSIIAIFSD